MLSVWHNAAIHTRHAPRPPNPTPALTEAETLAALWCHVLEPRGRFVQESRHVELAPPGQNVQGQGMLEAFLYAPFCLLILRAGCLDQRQYEHGKRKPGCVASHFGDHPLSCGCSIAREAVYRLILSQEVRYGEGGGTPCVAYVAQPTTGKVFCQAFVETGSTATPVTPRGFGSTKMSGSRA